jgi:hypothetical protein
MAATDREMLNIATAAKEVAHDLKQLRAKAQQLLGFNSSQAINWGEVDDQSHPNVVDSSGTFSSKEFTPDELSNFIGSIDNLFVTWWSTHGGNVENLSGPIV